MPEKPNKNVIEDTTKTQEKKSGVDLEIVSTPELEKLSRFIGAVQDDLDHNRSVELSRLLKIEEAVGKLVVIVEGKIVTVEELERDPELRENAKIWEEIRQGKFIFENIMKLTQITSEIAELLSHYGGAMLNLNGLTFLSDQAAEHLSHYRGILCLDGLSSLSDKAAKHLSQHQGELELEGITSLSDKAAEFFAEGMAEGKVDLKNTHDSVWNQIEKFRK